MAANSLTAAHPHTHTRTCTHTHTHMHVHTHTVLAEVCVETYWPPPLRKSAWPQPTVTRSRTIIRIHSAQEINLTLPLPSPPSLSTHNSSLHPSLCPSPPLPFHAFPVAPFLRLKFLQIVHLPSSRRSPMKPCRRCTELFLLLCDFLSASPLLH